jgi:hypothetical protein
MDKCAEDLLAWCRNGMTPEQVEMMSGWFTRALAEQMREVRADRARKGWRRRRARALSSSRET